MGFSATDFFMHPYTIYIIDKWISDTEFTPTVDNNPPTTKNSSNRTGLIVGIATGIAVLGFLFVLLAFCAVQRRKRSHTNDDEG